MFVDKKAVSENSLIYHISGHFSEKLKQTAGIKKERVCPICEKAFWKQEEMIRHLAVTHEELRACLPAESVVNVLFPPPSKTAQTDQLDNEVVMEAETEPTDVNEVAVEAETEPTGNLDDAAAEGDRTSADAVHVRSVQARRCLVCTKPFGDAAALTAQTK